MKKIVFVLCAIVAFVAMSFTTNSFYVKDTMNSSILALKSYDLKTHNVPIKLHFNGTSASSSFSVAVSNEGDVPVYVEVMDSNSNVMMYDFTVNNGLSYTPVRYFTGTGTGYVIIRVRKSNASGTAWGQVSVN